MLFRSCHATGQPQPFRAQSGLQKNISCDKLLVMIQGCAKAGPMYSIGFCEQTLWLSHHVLGARRADCAVAWPFGRCRGPVSSESLALYESVLIAGN